MDIIDKRGLMLVISSPSGAGKTSIAKDLLSKVDNLKLSISATTRAKRINETDAVEYFFVNKKEYDTMLAQDQFLEHAMVFDEYYGTPKKYVLDMIQNGFDVLFDVDWQGARQIFSKYPKDVVSIYILPPSLQDLQKRLQNRNLDHEKLISKRMSRSYDEISHYNEYDYVIINNDFEETLSKITCILKTERLKRYRNIWISDFVNKLLEDKSFLWENL